jgi:hypothetical protein
MPHTNECGLQHDPRNHLPLPAGRLPITQYASCFEFGNSPLHRIQATGFGTLRALNVCNHATLSKALFTPMD